LDKHSISFFKDSFYNNKDESQDISSLMEELVLVLQDGLVAHEEIFDIPHSTPMLIFPMNSCARREL
jgi:hypothetical protein